MRTILRSDLRRAGVAPEQEKDDDENAEDFSENEAYASIGRAVYHIFAQIERIREARNEQRRKRQAAREQAAEEASNDEDDNAMEE